MTGHTTTGELKIGEAALATSVSVNTIRFYVQRGLLNPVRKGSQYIFSEKDLEDIRYILSLKRMRLSLKEIETMIRYRRLSHGVEPSTMEACSGILRAKLEELNREQKEIEESMQLLTEELRSFENFRRQDIRFRGVPLQAMGLLYCPHCGKQLKVRDAALSQFGVEFGTLYCSCGYTAGINAGIVETGNLYQGSHDSPDLNRSLYNSLCDDLLRIYQQIDSEIMQELTGAGLAGKVIMEGNINGYFHLYNHLAELPVDALYIITDKYPETLRMYKNYIEQLYPDLRILYIADNDADLPLKKGCVDILLEFFSSIEWMLYHEESFIRSVRHLLAGHALVPGSFMHIQPSAESRRNLARKYPECSSKFYNFNVIREDLRAEGFSVTEKVMGSVYRTQNTHSYECHADGDELRFYRFSGKR